MTEVKKLKTGFGLILSDVQFQFFKQSLETYIRIRSNKVELRSYSVDYLLKLFIATGLFKRVVEKSIWAANEYKIKITVQEAFVLWGLHKEGLLNYPGDGAAMMQLEKLLNSL